MQCAPAGEPAVAQAEERDLERPFERPPGRPRHDDGRPRRQRPDENLRRLTRELGHPRGKPRLLQPPHRRGQGFPIDSRERHAQ